MTYIATTDVSARARKTVVAFLKNKGYKVLPQAAAGDFDIAFIIEDTYADGCLVLASINASSDLLPDDRPMTRKQFEDSAFDMISENSLQTCVVRNDIFSVRVKGEHSFIRHHVDVFCTEDERYA